ncbi:MAG: hypothetical protein ACI9CE_002521 [Flavobacterium sp.]|jgi:hypothetical protein
MIAIDMIKRENKIQYSHRVSRQFCSRALFVTILSLSSPQIFAASWFDSALEFIGFGTEENVTEEKGTAEKAPPAKVADVVNIAKALSLSSMVSSQLGVSQDQAQGGLGVLFGMAKSSLADADFAQISQQVPNMNTRLKAAPAISEKAAGLSSLMGSAGKYANTLQSSTKAYSQFKSLGLNIEQIPQYISVTNTFLESQGNDNIATLFTKGVSALIGGIE